MTPLRHAVVDGLLYPAQPAVLREQIAHYLEDAHADALAGPLPKLLISPHAGYEYCGPIAASAYALLGQGRGHGITRVVLLGPAHRVHVRGLAMPDAQAFETPAEHLQDFRRCAQALRA